MKKSSFYLTIYSIVFILLMTQVFSQSIHPMSSLVIFTNAEEYSIENLPLEIESTGFQEYCNLCDKDESCCAYCNIKCITEIKSTKKGSIVESVANFKFSGNYQIEKGLCPSLDVNSQDSCVDSKAIDINFDKVSYSLKKLNFTSNYYSWNDIFDSENYRYSLNSDFGLLKEDNKLIKSSNPPRDSITYKEIKEIISSENTSGGEGTIILSESARNSLNGIIFLKLSIYLSIIIIIILVILVILIKKSGKRKK